MSNKNNAKIDPADYMRPQKGLSVGVRRTIAEVVLIILSVICLIWFYILLVNSTRSHSQIMRGFSIIPGTSFFKNWVSLYTSNIPVLYGLLNSFIVSICCAGLCTYFSSMTAYAIHVYDFKFKNAIFTFILAVMMIPGQVTALGFLQVVDFLKMGDSFWPLILPCIASPITFYFMKQYMDSTLPLALIEAARIDGAGEFRTFNQVALPVMKPAIAVQAIFTFVTNWNNYFTPALILKTEKLKTLPILLAQLRSADYATFDMGKVYMMIAFSIFPVILVYIFLSKYIVQGVAAGSVKG